MASNTTSGRTVFVLGSEAAGNREVLIVEASQEYGVDAATIVTYTNDDAEFPHP